MTSFSKSFQNAFRSHLNAKPAFSISSCLKTFFEKLRFRDGLRTVDREKRDRSDPPPDVTEL